MRNFLITGLPRSRTAWLSHLFSVPGVWCEHEPSQRFASLDDLEHFWSPKGGSGWRIGAADHGLGWWLPEILERWNPRVLLIERPMADVLASVCKMGLPLESAYYLTELHRREQLARSHPNVMAIPYTKLDDASTMAKAWFHVLPGMAFDVDRFAYMRRFNIQLTDEWTRQLVRRDPPPLYDECRRFIKEHCHA